MFAGHDENFEKVMKIHNLIRPAIDNEITEKDDALLYNFIWHIIHTKEEPTLISNIFCEARSECCGEVDGHHKH